MTTVKQAEIWETFCSHCGDMYADTHDTEAQARAFVAKYPLCSECENPS